ncbi:beta-phosphoglucomutase [Caloramator quimbayensis]|uniref:Beta-phosphoglucomutase n=1 Tax=Caloramator quimbayensis TaxID=1147123 RepID=A0A1T4WW33_9CLOT|nr:beta-phosphoglucomutase [Caloramator quimbayensis]SKA81514.1 beta-phosphoglucomutase [Caloramator quimbayensis]
MSVKGCIFDLDGVIVDTAKYHYLAWKRLAEELGFEFTIKDNERLKGVSRMKSLEILLEVGGLKFDDETKIKLAEKKNNWYVEYISKIDKSEILTGVEKFLISLRENGIKTALGSASKNAMIILNNLGIEKYFDAIIDGNKVKKAKPDPEVFLLAAKELNIDPKECVVFEDAEAGIEAAKNAGMYAIGVGSSDKLHDADKVILGFDAVNIDIINF